MPSRPDAVRPPRHRPAPPRRLRRWLIGLAVIALLLAVYGLVLHRVTLQIGNDVENSLRSLPVMEEGQPRPVD